MKKTEDQAKVTMVRKEKTRENMPKNDGEGENNIGRTEGEGKERGGTGEI
jgi:hypothetical protein